LVVDQDRAQRAVKGARWLAEADFIRALVRHPGDPYLPLAGAAMALRTEDPRAMRFVARAMQLSPGWAEPHAMLARVLASHGLRAQALLETRYAASLSGHAQDVLATLVVRLSPETEALERTIPPGVAGQRFLKNIAASAAGTQYSVVVDALLLRRDPTNLQALVREARRAGQGGDPAREESIFEQVSRLYPDATAGYFGIADLRIAAGDRAGAEEVLRRGMMRAPDPAPYLERIAEVQAARHDGPAMRQTMQMLFDLAGAGIDRRVTLFGKLGALEVLLGNDALALGAFERADAMAFPQHPYIGHIVAAAARLGDINRLRGACGTLRDEGLADETQRETCARADRAPPGVVRAMFTGAGSDHPGAEPGSVEQEAPAVN
jgi:tetratricopeptide (TPR) repeat protein